MNRLTFSVTCRGWSEVRAMIRSSGNCFFSSASAASMSSPNWPMYPPGRIWTATVMARLRCQLPFASRQS